MKINKKSPLILRNLYVYDLEQCHLDILNKYQFDTSFVDMTDKTTRLISIGKFQRTNPKVTSLLRQTTNAIIDEYILRNSINDDDIVLRQYDGIILSVPLKKKPLDFMPLNLRNQFLIFISSIDKTKYIAFDGIKTTVKGLSKKYDYIKKIYDQICRLNFSSKISVFKGLQKIKNDFYKNDNPWAFAIPIDDKKYMIIFKQYGGVYTKKNIIPMIDCEDIDIDYYFNYYLEPFMKSISFHILKRR